eukprot:gene16076-biopygen10135
MFAQYPPQPTARALGGRGIGVRLLLRFDAAAGLTAGARPPADPIHVADAHAARPRSSRRCSPRRLVCAQPPARHAATPHSRAACSPHSGQSARAAGRDPLTMGPGPARSLTSRRQERGTTVAAASVSAPRRPLRQPDRGACRGASSLRGGMGRGAAAGRRFVTRRARARLHLQTPAEARALVCAGTL